MSQDDPPALDRRVRRTRAALGAAIMELMIEKGYDEVTVQDIIDRADVGRSTFYARFTHKEDLLAFSIDNLRSAVSEASTGGKADQPFGFSLPLLRHVHGQHVLYRALVGRRGGATVLHWFARMISDLVRENLATHQLPADIDIDEAVAFIAGGFNSLLTSWVDNETERTPEDLDRIFRTLVDRGIGLQHPT